MGLSVGAGGGGSAGTGNPFAGGQAQNFGAGFGQGGNAPWGIGDTTPGTDVGTPYDPTLQAPQVLQAGEPPPPPATTAPGGQQSGSTTPSLMDTVSNILLGKGPIRSDQCRRRRPAQAVARRPRPRVKGRAGSRPRRRPTIGGRARRGFLTRCRVCQCAGRQQPRPHPPCRPPRKTLPPPQPAHPRRVSHFLELTPILPPAYRSRLLPQFRHNLRKFLEKQTEKRHLPRPKLPRQRVQISTARRATRRTAQATAIRARQLRRATRQQVRQLPAHREHRELAARGTPSATC
jgi:hypothetical protein